MTQKAVPIPLSTRSRWLSAVELCIATVAVIGHNVFHVLPNEVPVLVVLALVSVGLREKSWSALGFRRPSSWRRGVLLAIGFVIVRWGIGYRGYIMKRAADAGGGGRIAWTFALIVASVLFGYGHFYKGPAGILDSGIAGLLMGGAFLLSGRCLWTTILAHGLSDTVAVV